MRRDGEKIVSLALSDREGDIKEGPKLDVARLKKAFSRSEKRKVDLLLLPLQVDEWSPANVCEMNAFPRHIFLTGLSLAVAEAVSGVSWEGKKCSRKWKMAA